MSDFPQNSDSIGIIEFVICIYEQEYPILRSQVFIPNILNSMDCAVNYPFKSGKELVHPDMPWLPMVL